MKIIDFVVILYVFILIVRGWLYFNYKNEKVSFPFYVKDILSVRKITSIIDLRLINNKGKRILVINTFTVVLYLMIIFFATHTFILN
jgi:hypothetical protein